MAYMVCGAVVFAAGALFGVWMSLVCQQVQKSKTSQRFQDALLKGMEKMSSNRKTHESGIASERSNF